MKKSHEVSKPRQFTLITETATGIVEHLLGAVPSGQGNMIVHLGARALRGVADDILTVKQIREAFDLACWADTHEAVFEGQVVRDEVQPESVE